MSRDFAGPGRAVRLSQATVVDGPSCWRRRRCPVSQIGSQVDAAGQNYLYLFHLFKPPVFIFFIDFNPE